MKRSSAREDRLEDYPTGEHSQSAASARNSPIATIASRCDFAKSLNENTAEEILRCCNLSCRVNLIALSMPLLIGHGSSEDSQARLRWGARHRCRSIDVAASMAQRLVTLGLRPFQQRRDPCNNRTWGIHNGLGYSCCSGCKLAVAWASCDGGLDACQSEHSSVDAWELPFRNLTKQLGLRLHGASHPGQLNFWSEKGKGAGRNCQAETCDHRIGFKISRNIKPSEIESGSSYADVRRRTRTPQACPWAE
jgi:hypothetical protein